MNKLSKQTKSLGIISIILSVVFLLVVVLVPFRKIAASWIATAFAVVAVGVCAYIFSIAFDNDKPLISKVYGFPLFRIGYIYLGAQFVFSVLILLVSHFVNTPYWVALLGSIIFLAVAVIGLIAVDNVKAIVEEMEEVQQAEIKKVTLFKINLDSVVDLCTEEDTKKKLEKLAEKFKYSDPVSSEETMALEEQLTNEIDVLRNLVMNNQLDDCNKQIIKVEQLLVERNRICKAYKK